MKRIYFKRILLSLIVILVLVAGYTYLNINAKQKKRDEFCFNALAKKLDNKISPDMIFKEDYENLQLLVEYSLVARTEMLEVFQKIHADTDGPLASRDLQILKQGTEDYLSIREDLFKIAMSYECGLDVSPNTLKKYNIDKQTHLKGLMLSLGAALTLYDNYFLGIVLYQMDARLRKVINDPDMGFGLVANKLEEMTLNVNSIETRHRIRKAITFYEDSKSILDLTEEDSDYLNTLIESSPSYNYIKKIRIKEIATNKLEAFEKLTKDRVSEISKDGFDAFSGLFGNTMGLFEFRKGKLYSDEQVKKKIQEELQPLDILLEKTPFRLTDKLIPGHFGHVAIWTGTKAELIDMGVWEEPYIKMHEKEISSKSNNDNSKDEHQIIEALRSGVKLSTLEDFLNVDDFAILRPKFKEDDKNNLTKEAIIMAFRQIGKKYDFNFDVNTTDKIVCSELAYVSFPSMDWPTEKTLGRYSISPDNVAKLAWNNVPLELVMFYHDGTLVKKEEQVDKMRALMEDSK